MIRRLFAAALCAAALTTTADAQLSGQVPGSLQWYTSLNKTPVCHDTYDVWAYIGPQTRHPGVILFWAEWFDIPALAGPPSYPGGPYNVWASGNGTINLKVYRDGLRVIDKTVTVKAVRDPFVLDTWSTADIASAMPFAYANLGAPVVDPVLGHSNVAIVGTPMRHVLWDCRGFGGAPRLQFSWDAKLKLTSILGTTGIYGFGINQLYKGVCADVATTIAL
jgi:hypothetical protein